MGVESTPDFLAKFRANYMKSMGKQHFALHHRHLIPCLNEVTSYCQTMIDIFEL